MKKNRFRLFSRVTKIDLKLTPQTLNFMLILFVVLITLFSNQDFGVRTKITFNNDKKEIVKLLDMLKSEMKRDSIILNELKNNDHYLEEYLRRNFNLVGKDEDVYVVK